MICHFKQQTDMKASEIAMIEDDSVILFGIDPGTKTGMAIWSATEKRYIEISTGTIHKAIGNLMLYAHLLHPDQIRVYVENPNTWTPFKRSEKNASKIQGAGSVKRDYAIWKEVCDDLGVQMIGTSIRGTAKKIDPKIFTHITGWQGRTSQHARDAAMLVFNRTI